jgi:hypothetical protein
MLGLSAVSLAILWMVCRELARVDSLCGCVGGGVWEGILPMSEVETLVGELRALIDDYYLDPILHSLRQDGHGNKNTIQDWEALVYARGFAREVDKIVKLLEREV